MRPSPNPFLAGKNTALGIKAATALFFSMAVAANAAILTWTGGGGVGRTAWSQKQNWNNTTLATLDTLQFGGTAELANNNDLTNATYNGLVFLTGAGAFTLSGTAFTLATNASGSGITNNSTNIQTVNLPITLSGAQTFNAASGALVLGGTIANANNLLTLTGANAITMNGVVSGTGGLTQSGTGTSTLSAANTFTGLTTVSGGTLAYGIANALSTGAVTVNGGILSIGTFSDAVGAVTLTSGSITGSTGVLTGSSYTFNNAGATTVSAILAGAGAMTQSGTGTTTLSRVNTNTGITTINTGILSVGTIGNGGVAGNLGQATNAATNLVLGGGTLQYTGATASTDRSFTLTAGTSSSIDVSTLATTLTMTGASTATTGALTKLGAGTLILSGANLHTGATTISAGVLNVQNATGLGATAGGTSVTSGAALQLQNNITVGAEALTLNGAGVATDGALRNISGTNSYAGSVTLGSTARINSDAGTLTLSGGITGATLGLTVGGAGATTISGVIGTTTGTLTKDGAGTLNLSAANTFTGLTTVSGGTLAYGVADALSSGGVTVNGGTLSIGTFSDSVGAVTLTSGSITGTTGILTGTSYVLDGAVDTSVGAILAGAGAMTKSGAGIATLSGNNTRTGVTTINAGTLSVGTIGNGAQAGNLGAATNAAANLVLGGGALRYTGATASTDRAFTLTAATTSSIDVSVAGTTLTMSGASAATTGALTKAGAGTLVLTGTNAHTGATSINAGTLSVATIGDGGVAGNLGAGSSLTLGGGTLSYTGATASTNRALTLTAATNSSIDVSTAATTLTMSGASAATTGGLIKSGAGTLELSGANAHTGSTAVNAGALRVTNSAGLGSTDAGTSVASGAALELSGGLTIGAEALTLNGSGVSGGGALRSVSGTNSFGGAITTGSASTIIADAGSLTLGGTLNSTTDTTFGGAGNIIVAGGLSGVGNIVKSGNGALTLSAGNSQANTTINAGQLNVNHLAALGTSAGTLTMATGTLLDNTSGASVTVTNPKSIALGSSLTFVGSDNLNLGTGTVTLSGNTEFNVAANELGFGGEVTGEGFGITKSGAGKLRLTGLTGSSSFTGNSFINAGTLTIGGMSTFGGTSATVVTVADGAFLEIAGTASLGNVTLVSRPEGLISSDTVTGNQSFSSNGALNPSNANFDGSVTIQAGVAVSASANYFGVTPATPQAGRIVFEDNSTLQVTAGFNISANQGISLASGTANLDVNAGQALTIESSVAGSGGLLKLGSGNVRLTGVNTYTGGTVVSSGILGISNGAALGDVSGRLKLDGGTLVGAQVVSGQPISAVTVAAERSLVLANGKTSGMDAQTGLSLSYDGVISEENGAGAAAGLRFGSSAARTGTVILGGQNTYQGATTIDFGTLSVSSIGNGGVAGNLGAASNAASNLVLGGGTLQYTGASSSTDRAFTLTAGTSSGINVATAETTLTMSGGSAATTGALVKSGAGTLALTGENTYTGATTVAGGKLKVNGTTASSAVGVSSGASLGGSGTVGGNLTIASGGALAPGNSPGVLTVAGTSTFNSGSIFEWELDTAQANPTTNRGVAYDGVNTTSLAGSGAIFKILLTGTQDFSDYAFWSQNRSWTDIFKSADGSTTLTDWASVFSGGFQYSYNGKTVEPTSSGSFTLTGNSLTWSAVPEPTNALAGLLAACMLLRRRRMATQG